MKKFKLMALVMSLVLALSACGGAAASTSTSTEKDTSTSTDSTEAPAEVEQVLRVSMTGGDPDNINPLTLTTVEANEIIGGVMEMLVHQGQESQTCEQGSGLAESWDLSEDKLVYTFHLRDAVWSDGSPITADQFVYCWQKVLDPATASEYAYMLYPVLNAEEYNTGAVTDANEVGVKAIDDKTLEVTLHSVCPYFISSLTTPQFGALPVGFAEEAGDQMFLDIDHMVFSGPFTITEWIPDQSMTLEKNPNFWDADSVKLDKLIYEFAKETNTIVNMYDTDVIDLMQVQPDFFPLYSSDPNFITVAEPVTEYMFFNCANEYFANQDIRLAFSLALDRTTLVNDVLQSGGSPAYAYVPEALAGPGGASFRATDPELFTDMGNSDTAEAEAVEHLNKGLEALGITLEEFNQGLNLVTGEGDSNLKMSQVMQECWKNVLGVDVEIRSLAYALRQDAYKAEDYSIGKEGWGADYDDAMSFMELFESDSPYNKAHFFDDEFDAMISESRVLEGDARQEKMQEAERHLLEYMSISPIQFSARSWVSKADVNGIVRRGIGLRADYRWAYMS